MGAEERVDDPAVDLRNTRVVDAALLPASAQRRFQVKEG
jgi:hypothetical protein